jgi:hypothetical protein
MYYVMRWNENRDMCNVPIFAFCMELCIMNTHKSTPGGWHVARLSPFDSFSRMEMKRESECSPLYCGTPVAGNPNLKLLCIILVAWNIGRVI